ncbi:MULTISPECIES: hypothetical protein [Lacticaseibacillus]|uniref:Uncharacterized protein n=2 Tax=Lacticaseibacillus TaxID=2759736 RepID=A0ABW4CF47_9LACO|nr:MULTISPECIES: hypothetical protein [Lacticaseibacillus]
MTKSQRLTALGGILIGVCATLLVQSWLDQVVVIHDDRRPAQP